MTSSVGGQETGAQVRCLIFYSYILVVFYVDIFFKVILPSLVLLIPSIINVIILAHPKFYINIIRGDHMNEQEFVQANDAWKELEAELKLFRKISEKQNIDKHRIDRFVTLYNKGGQQFGILRGHILENLPQPITLTGWLGRLTPSYIRLQNQGIVNFRYLHRFSQAA